MAEVPQWNGRGVWISSEEREARLLTKGEQLPCSGCVKALPSLASPGHCQWEKLGVGKGIWNLARLHF